MRPTLRQLEYAVAVARTGSFSRAARECGVTQPGLSTQVRQLERALEVEVFERRPRRVMVTQAGERVIELATKVLGDVDTLVDTAAALTDPLQGTIRLGVIPTIAPYLLPRAMPAFRHAFPDLRLLLREEQTNRLVELVEHGSLDLILVALESDLRQLEVRPLFVDPFVLAVAADHRLAGRKRVKADDLSGEDVLLLEDGHCLREQTTVICEAAGANEVGDFRATSLNTLLPMVENGVGVTLLPSMAARKQSVDGGLRLIPFSNPAPSRTATLAWRPSSPHRQRFEAFAKELAAVGSY